ncbi:TetR/AcrR family transcriptional regulator C-terminal domain-containing protein [Streptomyces sp. NPDC057877]|uniref:TetR/AcrR family transcriptional regulator C-terminal domain-containing protein n=1 Tax=Streptomyces sp. NPDC057877 TaxID=3346269 RepID=UPI0036B5FDCF
MNAPVKPPTAPRSKPDAAHLVAAEVQRFPELGRAWRQHGPEGHHPAVANALHTLADEGRLAIPDLEAALIQLYELLVFPLWSSAPTARTRMRVGWVTSHSYPWGV